MSKTDRVVATLFPDRQPEDRAPIEVVRLLEGMGYDRDKTKKWTATRAWQTLSKCKRDDAVAVRRAATLARTQEDAPPPSRGQPSQLEREVAAAFLVESLAGPIDDLVAGLLHVSHAFTDDEARRLAGYLIRMLRNAERGATAPAGDGVRDDSEGGGWEADASPIPE
jgi:hypothetical protein